MEFVEQSKQHNLLLDCFQHGENARGEVTFRSGEVRGARHDEPLLSVREDKLEQVRHDRGEEFRILLPHDAAHVPQLDRCLRDGLADEAPRQPVAKHLQLLEAHLCAKVTDSLFDAAGIGDEYCEDTHAGEQHELDVLDRGVGERRVLRNRH